MNDQQNSYGNQTVSFGQPASDGPTIDAAGQAAAVKDVTTASFTADVIQDSRNQPVLVDFWAPWCGPCKQLAPVLEKVVAEAGGRVKLVKMNIDDHPSIAGQLGIQSIPAVIAFRDGQPVDGFMGAVPESQIREFIDRLGGQDPNDNALEQAIEQAGQQRQAGNLQAATQLYAAILQQAPDNLDAIAGLAEILVEAGDLDNAREVLARAPDDSADAPQLASARSQIELAERVAELGDAAALEDRLKTDANDHQARFDLALIENAKGNRDAAAEHLLTIIKTDREWNEDGARKQLLQFFEAWGMSDSATLAARRKLSTLLFS